MRRANCFELTMGRVSARISGEILEYVLLAGLDRQGGVGCSRIRRPG